jgi:hypothetical protein
MVSYKRFQSPPPKVPHGQLTEADVRDIVNAVVDPAKEYAQTVGKSITDTLTKRIEDEIRPLVIKIDGLERRLAEFEQSGMRYAGIFSRVCSYDRGSVVSHSGASWFCLRSHTGLVPGAAPDAWIMVAKGAPEPVATARAQGRTQRQGEPRLTIR